MEDKKDTRGGRVAVIIVACVVAAMALVAVGCGSSGGGGSSSSTPSVVIGVDASMSGPLAGFGAYEKWAIETYVNKMNATGGVTIDGKKTKVDIVLLDDKSDPNVAASNIDTLVTKNKAIALIGPVTPAVGNAAALAAERNRTPYLETGNPLEPFRAVKQWTWAWNFFFAAPDLAKAAFQSLADLGITPKTNKQVFICTDNSPDGPVFLGAISASAKAAGWKIAGTDTHPSNATEFGSLIGKLKNSNADYVIFLGDTPQEVALRKQMASAGYAPKILYFVRGAQLQQFADALGALSDGIILESYWLPEMPYPGAAQLGQEYASSTGQSIGQILGLEYTAAQILTDAITKANSADATKINTALGQTSGMYVGGPVTFNAPNHTSVTPLFFTQWQNKKSIIIWPASVANGKMIYPLP
jgi:branched-chain amino acid transport system substrate-binding protein